MLTFWLIKDLNSWNNRLLTIDVFRHLILLRILHTLQCFEFWTLNMSFFFDFFTIACLFSTWNRCTNELSSQNFNINVFASKLHCVFVHDITHRRNNNYNANCIDKTASWNRKFFKREDFSRKYKFFIFLQYRWYLIAIDYVLVANSLLKNEKLFFESVLI